MATEVSANPNGSTQVNPAVIEGAAKSLKAGDKSKAKATKGLTDLNSVIVDAAKASEFIGRAISMYQASGPMIHTAAMTAMWHCAKHGNPALMQRVFDGLRPNDQSAMRLFIRRASIIAGTEGNDPFDYDEDGNALPLDPEFAQAALDAGKLVDLKNGTFVVVNGHTSPVAKTWVKLIETRFIKPDGKFDKMLLDRNNFSEVRVLTDNTALKGLLQQIKRIEAGDTDRQNVNMSKGVRKFFAEIKDKAQAMLNQTPESLAKG